VAVYFWGSCGAIGLGILLRFVFDWERLDSIWAVGGVRVGRTPAAREKVKEGGAKPSPYKYKVE